MPAVELRQIWPVLRHRSGPNAGCLPGTAGIGTAGQTGPQMSAAPIQPAAWHSLARTVFCFRQRGPQGASLRQRSAFCPLQTPLSPGPGGMPLPLCVGSVPPGSAPTHSYGIARRQPPPGLFPGTVGHSGRKLAPIEPPPAPLVLGLLASRRPIAAHPQSGHGLLHPVLFVEAPPETGGTFPTQLIGPPGRVSGPQWRRAATSRCPPRVSSL